MTDSKHNLEDAALDVNSGSLEEARSAISQGCEEWLRLAKILSERLETIATKDLHKFAKALALMILGQLPTRPNTCPCASSTGKIRSCGCCDYAMTHGWCDSDASAFSLFIEAFQVLGNAIHQDTEGQRSIPMKQGKHCANLFAPLP